MKVLNVGLESFFDSLKQQNVDALNSPFKPIRIIDELKHIYKNYEKVHTANEKAVKILQNSYPILVDLKQAKEVIPELKNNLILHAGPPISINRLCGPVRGAIIGSLIYEKMVKTYKQAEEILDKGKIKIEPCHHYGAVGPMSGVLSKSMWVFVVKNKLTGNIGYCSLNEGLGKVLRFGANSKDVIDRLKWMEEVLGPILKEAIKLKKEIDLRSITSQALLMGDECHNRNIAATTLFLKEIIPSLLETKFSKKDIKSVIDFISNNPHFYLNISMAACKSTADGIKGIKHSSIVYAMARNGTDIGIRIAGMPDEWFVHKAGIPKGLFFPGYTQKHANPDLGDSTISEVAGIGAFAMAAAPAITKFVGGTPEDAVNYTLKMYKITDGEHSFYQIPYFNFRGTPIGMNILKVVETGITPFINTGIAHKKAGIGQIGAGLLFAPMEVFENSVKKFAKILK